MTSLPEPKVYRIVEEKPKYVYEPWLNHICKTCEHQCFKDGLSYCMKLIERTDRVEICTPKSYT